jgi:SpoVK/Ycf46/Vps4 family AAA+-type ATPase
MKAADMVSLFRACSQYDVTKVRQILKSQIESERKKGHLLVANRLEKVFNSDWEQAVAKPQPQSLSFLFSEKCKEFVSVKHNFDLRHHMILSQHQEDALRQIERGYAARDRLVHHGLDCSRRVIFYGPPGCGKTMAAERIAHCIGLPLVVLRADSVISSYLGDTLSNIKRVFQEASRIRCVLFLDGCDSFFSSRENSEDSPEMKRCLNLLLQLLDEHEFKSDIFIAATNLPQVLDSAIWRRFDDSVRFLKPAPDEVRVLILQEISRIEREFMDIDFAVDMMSGLSHSQIVKICRSALRRAIIDDQKILTKQYLRESFKGVVCQ